MSLSLAASIPAPTASAPALAHEPLLRGVYPRKHRTNLEVISSDPICPLNLLDVRAESFTYPLHFHPELELTLVIQGRGQRYIGDSIQNFGPGDLILVGAHTPHCWLSDRILGQSVRALVVQFPENIFGEDFLSSALGRPLQNLFDRAAQGLSFSGPLRDRVIAKLKALFAGSHNPLDRTGMLLQILSELTAPEDQVILGLGSHANLPKSNSPAVLDLVIAHIDEHLDQEMTQRQVARLAGLSTAGFSRFFSRHFGKTFVTYVAELRIKRACQLLLGNEYSIAEVARLSGFHNLANFNRRFFRFKGMTPSEYRRLARNQSPRLS